MAANKKFSLGPIALTTTTTTNLMNPGTTTGGTNSTAAPYDKTQVTITHIRVANTTAGSIFVALWKGATGTNASGKEYAFAGTATAGALDSGKGVSVPANSYVDYYTPGDLFTTSDFLVGGASASGLTIKAEGEIGIA